MSVNVQSMNNKFQEISDITHRIMPSNLCLQEIWGRSTTKDYSIKYYHKSSIVTRKGDKTNIGLIQIWTLLLYSNTHQKNPYNKCVPPFW